MFSIPPRAELRHAPLLGRRVSLVPLDATDARELFAAVESSRAFLEPWLPWVPFVTDQDSSFRYAETSALDWDQGRACRFSIRERTTHAFLGVVGLEMLQHVHLNCDLGYWLRQEAHRQGFMTEACEVVLAWVFARLGAHRVRVAAATDNHASLGVIRKLGFRFEGISREAEFCRGRWLDHASFGMLERERRM